LTDAGIKAAPDAELVAQFSSIGSVQDKFLNEQLAISFNVGFAGPHRRIKIIYPSEENVRTSIEGYEGVRVQSFHATSCSQQSGTGVQPASLGKIRAAARFFAPELLPLGSFVSIEVLTPLYTYLFLWHSWCDRTRANPHIKTYGSVSAAHKTADWFLLTSANLSKVLN
jgi:hypothetical protein